MNNIIGQLTKKINWYRPAVLQVVEFNLPTYDYLVSLGLLKHDKVCGVLWRIKDINKINVSIEIPPRDVTSLLDIMPSPHPSMMNSNKMGLVADSLNTTIKTRKDKTKEVLHDELKIFYSAVIEKHTPLKCISAMVWGAPLDFLYSAALKNIACLGIIPESRENNPPKYWDYASRNMYGYLTTVYNLTEIGHKSIGTKDTLRNVYVEVIEQSDVCVFHQSSPKNTLFNSLRNVAASKNKLFIDVTKEWSLFSEGS